MKSTPPVFLIKISNAGPAEDYFIFSGDARIGRCPEQNDLVLDFESVSRVHATISHKKGQPFLKDMKSTNGCFIRNRRLKKGKKTWLKDREIFRMGEATLQFFAIPPKSRLFSLEVESPEQGIQQKFYFSRPWIKIGRSIRSDLILNSHHVSGSHAEILLHKGRFSLQDIGSANGTRVNGEKIKSGIPISIADGDRIRISGYSMRFSMEIPLSEAPNSTQIRPMYTRLYTPPRAAAAL